MAHHKKNKRSGFNDAVSMVTAVAMVVIAVLMVLFVYMYIKDSSGGLFSFFNNNGEKESTAVHAGGEPDEGDFDLSLDSDRYGLLDDGNGSFVYVLDPAAAAEYDEEQKLKDEDGRTLLRDVWIEIGDRLYYFGADGRVPTGRFSEGAMNYAVATDGAVGSITYNPGYRPDPGAVSHDYPGLAQTKTLWAYVDESRTLGNFYTIMYKKTTESLSHMLGGTSNPQYTSLYAMQVHNGYIYYLARGSEDPGGALDAIQNKLFRMRAGDTVRERAAEGVYGYKVITGADGRAAVYWYDGSQMHRTAEYTEDNSVVTFPEDGNYYIDTESRPGHAILMLEGGHPVTMASQAFTAGNFTYQLSGTGEILGVAPKTSITAGGATYSFETSNAFGSERSRLIRKEADGSIHVISSEFLGHTGNMHYDYATGEMFAEFWDENNYAGILRFNNAGDIDYLQDATAIVGSYELYGIQGNSVILHRKTENSDSVISVRARISTPIAVSIDPMLLEADDPDTSTVLDSTSQETASGISNVSIEGPGGGDPNLPTVPASIGPGAGQGDAAGPGASETAAASGQDYDTEVAGQPTPSEGASANASGTDGSSGSDGSDSGSGGTEVVQGPGSEQEIVIFAPSTVEQVGPGSNAPGGD